MEWTDNSRTTQRIAWEVFRLGRGEECRTEANARTALDLMEVGYLDTCEILIPGKQVDNALILRERGDFNSPRSDAPRTFDGHILDVTERFNGKDRLLGRRLTGRLTTPLPQALSRYGVRDEPVRLGPKIDFKEFETWATHMTFDDLNAPPKDVSTAELLDATERYFDLPAVSESAAYAWGVIAQNRGRNDPEVIIERIERFLARKDSARVLAALGGLTSIRGPLSDDDRDKLKPLLREQLAAMEAGAKVVFWTPDQLRREMKRLSLDD